MPAPSRWRALVDITVEPPAAPQKLHFPAGEECKGAPDKWPPAWLVEQGLVEKITDAPTGKEG